MATAFLNRIAFAVHDQQEFVMPAVNKIEWPRRPPRLGRLFDNVRPFYFVTFNTYKRQNLLARPEIHETFCIFCSKAQEHGVAVGRYVIMPDHVHLFAAFPIDGIALPAWIQSLRNVLGKKLLELKISKPHWQEGFFDHLLRSHESYSQKWEYVRMNPLRAKLCERPEACRIKVKLCPFPLTNADCWSRLAASRRSRGKHGDTAP